MISGRSFSVRVVGFPMVGEKSLWGLCVGPTTMPCRAVPCRAVPFVTFFSFLEKKM
jgi:hypothetical protein